MKRALVSAAVLAALATPLLAPPLRAQTESPARNKRIIRDAFARQAQGRGGVLDLLTDDAKWTVTGHALASGVFTSKRAFLRDAVAPITARLKGPIVPTVRALYSDGDTVVALWDGRATAKDGKPYRNTYAWFLTMRGGRIVRGVAVLDSAELDDLLRRVPRN